MSSLLEVVSRLEGIGGRLSLDGERIRYSIPKGNLEAQSSLAELRERRSDLVEFLRARAVIPAMPAGVTLLSWKLKRPPVAIETSSVVTDSARFARTTLEQLGRALRKPSRWVGWSVPQLVDRLAQVGVIVALTPNSGSPMGPGGDAAASAGSAEEQPATYTCTSSPAPPHARKG